MERNIKSLITNLGLLISGFIAAFSGLLIQIKYHLGNHGNIQIKDSVMGMDYPQWSTVHKYSIVLLSIFVIFHIILHWKWYKIVVQKGLFAKNQQLITLSVIFILVAITGFIPWLINSYGYDEMFRRAFLEIHDKLTIVLIVYLVLHIKKRQKWFFSTIAKLIKKQNS